MQLPGFVYPCRRHRKLPGLQDLKSAQQGPTSCAKGATPWPQGARVAAAASLTTLPDRTTSQVSGIQARSTWSACLCAFAALRPTLAAQPSARFLSLQRSPGAARACILSKSLRSCASSPRSAHRSLPSTRETRLRTASLAPACQSTSQGRGPTSLARERRDELTGTPCRTDRLAIEVACHALPRASQKQLTLQPGG